MDPQETLKLLVEADTVEERQTHADNLTEWLRKGGFVPTVDRQTLLVLLKGWL